MKLPTTKNKYVPNDLQILINRNIDQLVAVDDVFDDGYEQYDGFDT